MKEREVKERKKSLKKANFLKARESERFSEKRVRRSYRNVCTVSSEEELSSVKCC